LFRALREDRGTADALLCVGFLARVEENYAAARAYLQEALAVARSVNYPFIVAASLHHLGMMAADADHDYARAQRLLEQSLATYRAVGLPRFLALVACSLADVLRIGGERGQARSLLREALTLLAEIGEPLGVSLSLEASARLVHDDRRPAEAVQLAAAASHLRTSWGTSLWPTVERSRAAWLQTACEALGETAYSTAWQAGQGMTAPDAIATALHAVTARSNRPSV
jgi:tetratricopeptide (TPR) repeat protein